MLIHKRPSRQTQRCRDQNPLFLLVLKLCRWLNLFYKIISRYCGPEPFLSSCVRKTCRSLSISGSGIHDILIYTFLQSVIHRPMLPRPATSTTFSCQLSKTLMAAPVDSLVAPGRPDIWLKPVAWGVRLLPALEGVLGAPLDEDELAIPLYLVWWSVLFPKTAPHSQHGGKRPPTDT